MSWISDTLTLAKLTLLEHIRGWKVIITILSLFIYGAALLGGYKIIVLSQQFAASTPGVDLIAGGVLDKLSYYVPHVVSVFLLPLLAVFLGYNLINQDLNTGSMKFLVTQVSRTSIVAGRFLGLSSVFLIITFLPLFVYALALHLSLQVMLSHWTLLFIYGLAFFSLALLLSSVIRNTTFSLLASVVVIMAMVILLFTSYSFLSLFSFVSINPFSRLPGAWLPLLGWTLGYFLLSMVLFGVQDL
ncbi:ABC transporter permease [Candidatus Woesearchaeota archaeon]|nr:ABC transporter permease [Candidatus Woesearchaeota archaeon]